MAHVLDGTLDPQVVTDASDYHDALLRAPCVCSSGRHGHGVQRRWRSWCCQRLRKVPGCCGCADMRSERGRGPRVRVLFLPVVGHWVRLRCMLHQVRVRVYTGGLPQTRAPARTYLMCSAGTVGCLPSSMRRYAPVLPRGAPVM